MDEMNLNIAALVQLKNGNWLFLVVNYEIQAH